MIITRYLSREIFISLLATSSILLLIFIAEQFLSYFRVASHGSLTLSAVFLLLSLQIPILLTILLPLSLFLSVILAYGRLYVDNEMTILSACGISDKTLLFIAVRFAFIVAIFVTILAFYLAPRMEEISEHFYQTNTEKAAYLSMPGRFSSIHNDKWIFYVEDTAKDNRKLKHVFVAEEPFEQREKSMFLEEKKTAEDSKNDKNNLRDTPLGVIFAEGGYYKGDRDNKFLVLTNGNRYLGGIGRKAYQVINFKEYGIRLQQKTLIRLPEKSYRTKFLLQHIRQNNFFAEFNWRFSLPIATLILAIIAVILSKISFRSSRYASFVPAILFYITYAYLLFLTRSWLIKGVIPPLIGALMAHIAMLFLAVILILVISRKRK